MKQQKVKRPYSVHTGTMSAWYETLEEAETMFTNRRDFYVANKGKYGDHHITLNRNTKTIREVVILCE
jgi:hypothetical protein